jgi:hypothetical protein
MLNRYRTPALGKTDQGGHMAQIVGFLGQSHSPLWSVTPPTGPAEPGASFVGAVDRCRTLLAKTRPDAVVLFGPGHFRFACYDMMLAEPATEAVPA